MRRALACALVAGLALAGCGGGSEQPARPTVDAGGPVPAAGTPQPLDYVGGARAALSGGAVGVVDLSNRVAVQPTKMDVNGEQQMSGLRWIGWGGEETTAHGDVRTLVCDPNCAGGRLEHSRGELVLSSVKDCDGRRFYTRSTMTYEDPDTGKTRAPATYLRTPPC